LVSALEENLKVSRKSGLAFGWYQGCQMVCFQTKNPNLGKFLGVLQFEDVGIF
jgi:hypothetical protein